MAKRARELQFSTHQLVGAFLGLIGLCAFVFLLGLLSTFILAMARPLFSLFLLVYGSAGLWYGSFFLLREQSVFVNPLVPGLVLHVH